jgi:hypothetical protein
MTTSGDLADMPTAALETDTFEAELAAMRACAQAIEPLAKEAQQRILAWLMERYSAGMPVGQRRGLGVSSTPSSSGVDQVEVTAKRFLQEKTPQSDVERIAVLAYYLTHHRDKQHFHTADLTALNTEAAQPRFSNAANAASNAVKSSGFLADAGKGMRQLTVKGEEAVDALPDRGALKAVMEKYASPRRPRPAKGSRIKAED